MMTETLARILNYTVIIYIVAPFACVMVGLVLYIMGRRISAAAFDKIIELLKWYIISVALVLTTKMVETTFTERETGIKEMQTYDKYVTTILEADNIEQRWRLAEYFSTVTPTDRLRDRWIAYRDTIRKDYTAYRQLKENEKALLLKDSLTETDAKALATVQTQLLPMENKLATTAADHPQLQGPVFIQITRSELRPYAEKISAQLTGIGCNVQGIELVKVDLQQNEIRYLKKTDLTIAEGLKRYLASINCPAVTKDISYIGAKAKPGTIEIWLSKGE